MINFLSLFKSTKIYKILKDEKDNGFLNHAYLLLHDDGEFLGEYLKIMAMLIMCENGDACGGCRNCKLIKEGNLPDVMLYPKDKNVVLTEDVSDLIDKSFIKPLEGDKKVFIINHAENINIYAQNKLLKTLEEPTNNTYILLGATSEYSILPTIKSRVKKLELSSFSDSDLFLALKEDRNIDKLNSAISCSNRTVGDVLKIYNDENFEKIKCFIIDVLTNMNSSSQILEYSSKTEVLKVDFDQFISIFSLILRDFLLISQNKENLVIDKNNIENYKKTSGFKSGSIIFALSKLVEVKKRKQSNTNTATLTEWLYFGILEGKYKWQKL